MQQRRLRELVVKALAGPAHGPQTVEDGRFVGMGIFRVTGTGHLKLVLGRALSKCRRRWRSVMGWDGPGATTLTLSRRRDVGDGNALTSLSPRDALHHAFAVPLQSPPAVPPARHILVIALFGGRSLTASSAAMLSIAFREVGRLSFSIVLMRSGCSTASRRVTREASCPTRPQGPRTRRLWYSFLQFQVLRSFRIIPEASVAAPSVPVPWQVGSTFASRSRGTVRLGRIAKPPSTVLCAESPPSRMAPPNVDFARSNLFRRCRSSASPLRPIRARP